jgi:iron complex outermembrane receptor protein
MKNTLLHISCLFALSLSAQDVTVSIPEVELEEKRIRFEEIGRKQLSLDSVAFRDYHSLSDFLRQQGPVYVKEYGALASASFRGTTAAHTQMVWNDVPLNALTHGQVDLALFPLQHFSSVELLLGGRSASLGSGAMGGSIVLDDAFSYGNRRQQLLQLTKGSFGKQAVLWKHELGRRNAYQSFSYSQHSVDNDFPYLNTAKEGSPIEYQEHAARTDKQLMGQYAKRLMNGHSWNVNTWLTQTYRQVPTSMLTAVSAADQWDEAQRFHFSWLKEGSDYRWTFSQALIKEQFRYMDSFYAVDSRFSSYMTYTQGKVIFDVSDHLKWKTGVLYSLQGVENNYYLSSVEDSLLATWMSWDWRSEGWAFSVTARKEQRALYDIPLIASFSTECYVSPSLLWKAQFGNHFRAPSFNDLYWYGPTAMGNPDLEAETSNSMESSFHWRKRAFSIDVSVYSQDLRQMIQWKPTEGVWTPRNLHEVWARGVDLNMSYQQEIFRLQAFYAYTRSTLEESVYLPQDSWGAQLEYIPLHKASIYGVYSQKDWELSASLSHNGMVYTEMKEGRALLSYQLLDISFHKQWEYLGLHFTVKNVWDEQYQAYEWYPSPGRHYELTMNINF